MEQGIDSSKVMMMAVVARRRQLPFSHKSPLVVLTDGDGELVRHWH